MATAATNLNPEDYRTGRERYVRFAEDFLGVDVTMPQRRVLISLAENRRTIVTSGNGPGKSYIAGVANLCFLYCNLDSIGIGTSGTYSVLEDVMYKPMLGVWNNARRNGRLPPQGRDVKGPPRIILDDEWYFKAVSPRDPENIEGRHAGTIMVTIEEADKEDITDAHFESARSLITSAEDRMLVIANPPHDENNCIYDRMESDKWEHIQFSSFDSRNVRRAMGYTDEPYIPGIVDLDIIRDDWEEWHDEPWPGAKVAMNTEERDDLSTRWYRRRLGIMPPDSSIDHRPITVALADGAKRGREPGTRFSPAAIGIDVARSGDRTVVFGVNQHELRVLYKERGTDHTKQKSRIFEIIDKYHGHPGIAIDANGEGSGLADEIAARYDDVYRFNAGENAGDERQYKDAWSEGLDHLGDWLEDGVYYDSDLEEELISCARNITFEEKYYSSREDTVFKADPKDKIKDDLDKSPDCLDAALQAVWKMDGCDEGITGSGTGTW